MKQLSMFSEIIVDNFAGGGGASTGIELAIGKSVDIAINHDPAAIAPRSRRCQSRDRSPKARRRIPGRLAHT